MDEELFLSPIKRIEVIRGPGSVLWGPDAFAGIVNIVPERGRDVDGISLDAQGGTPNKNLEATIKLGKNAGPWEGFLALSARRLSPVHDSYNVIMLKGNNDLMPVPFEERFGNGGLDDSVFAEAVFNFSWKDWLKLSGRWADDERNYVFKDPLSHLTWNGRKENPFRYIRLEADKRFVRSSLRFNGYYNELIYSEQQVDLSSWEQKSRVTFGELLYDRELWEAEGLLTLGLSYRHDNLDGAIVKKPYVPDFFDPNNVAFLPIVYQDDFSTSLASAFAQVRRRWNNVDAWLGARFDDHSEYRETFSYNMGLSWRPHPKVNTKLLFGTAYRTPYNQQLVDKEGLDPEEVRNLSLHTSWKPASSLKFSITGFWNNIHHHIQEDSLGGLSDPGKEDIYGLEVDAMWKPSSKWTLWANATAFTQNGDDESYTIFVRKFINGEFVKVPFASWETPFDTGPDGLFNAGVLYQPYKWFDLSMRLRYANSWDYYFTRGENKSSAPSSWIFDTTLTARDFIHKGVDVQLAVKNLLGEDYEVPGVYGPYEISPFNAYLGISWRY
jgi:outer membrane receptor protein involved in Fe transport